MIHMKKIAQYSGIVLFIYFFSLIYVGVFV